VLVIFVCTGNICRSPMAEYLLRSWLERRGVEGISVGSMGTLGLAGEPASRLALQVCRERGVDISAHRSRPLDPAQLGRASVIFTMELVHSELVAACCPEAADRTRLLGAWPQTDERLEHVVPDPMGRQVAYYREVARRIEGHIDRIAPVLVQQQRCQPPST